MASLTQKRDCKNWIACITFPDGARTQRSTGTDDKKLAQKIATDWEDAANKAKKNQFVEKDARRTLNEILRRAGEDTMSGDTVDHFLREWLAGKHNEGTNERYAHVVELFLKHLEKRATGLLSNISHKDAQNFIKSRESQNMASKTVRVDAKILGSAFNLARKLGFIESNPFEKALALKPIKVVSSKRDTFTTEQVALLLDKAEGEWKSVVTFGFFIGARLDDCAKMRWTNIDFAKGLVDYIAKKSGHRVVVPMLPQLQTHLEEIASTDSTNPFISPTLATKSTSGKYGLSESFKRIMLAAGIDPQIIQGQGKRKFSQLSFHSLRHSFNSLLANNGVDQEIRMALVGQTTKAINKDYTHLDLNKLRGAMAKLPIPKLAVSP